MPSSCATSFHLLGRVDFDALLALQDRLVYEAGHQSGGAITVLLAEHEELITIGRAGSRAQVRLSGQELERRRVKLRYLARGGGAILHAPGQLAIYPIVSLAEMGWSVGEYLRRLSAGLSAALASLGVAASASPTRFGVWGRTGPLALVAAAVRRGVTSYGAYVNVNPPKSAFGYVDSDYAAAADAPGRRTLGSLLAECGRAARMPRVRTAVIEHLASAFETPRSLVTSGHPLLASSKPKPGILKC